MKKLAKIAKNMKIAGENHTIWYWSVPGSMCKNIPYTQNTDVNKAIPMAMVYQAVRRPRISAGASSTIDMGPVTLSEPIPMPEIIRAVYKPAHPGEAVAIICPRIQIEAYRRKDHLLPIRSLTKNDEAAPTA
jgi:hypothetical protein